uniref:SPRY domain-containing protein n=1 Tax=Aplanochytrium stocchinoi TaxID=215587 RepID=A0A7S3LPJ5_9STRA
MPILCAEENDVEEYTAYLANIEYFEMTFKDVESVQESSPYSVRYPCLSIGLATDRFPEKRQQPGWRHGSWGYHGDDGKCFHRTLNQGFGELETFGLESKRHSVGCGLIRCPESPLTMILFFISPSFAHQSVNIQLSYDQQFGVGIRNLKNFLCPTFGVDSHRSFSVNFGMLEPFTHSYTKILSLEHEIKRGATETDFVNVRPFL